MSVTMGDRDKGMAGWHVAVVACAACLLGMVIAGCARSTGVPGFGRQRQIERELSCLEHGYTIGVSDGLRGKGDSAAFVARWRKFYEGG